jgi:hypothetical protein
MRRSLFFSSSALHLDLLRKLNRYNDKALQENKTQKMGEEKYIRGTFKS